MSDSNLPLFITEINCGDKEFENISLRIEHLKTLQDPDLQSIKESMMVFLEKIGCLVNYELISIREIRVSYPKYKDMRFIHSISVLNGDNPSRYEEWGKMGNDIKNIFIDQTEAAHSHSVILINRNAKKPVEHINLWPLVIDANAYSYEKDNPEVFCYVGQQDDDFLYEPIQMIKGSKSQTIRELENQAYIKPFEDLIQ